MLNDMDPGCVMRLVDGMEGSSCSEGPVAEHSSFAGMTMGNIHTCQIQTGK